MPISHVGKGSIWISAEAFALVKAQAAAERRTISQVASYAIEQYVNAQRERGEGS